MHTFQSIKKLNQAVQVSLLGEASAYNFSVLKRPKYGPSAMPKGHSLIKYKNQYFLFTSEPPSEGQGATNPNWTKAAIWQCDRNGKRTAPLEDPLWDSKKDGWSAEDAFDSFLDYTGGDLSEAAKAKNEDFAFSTKQANAAAKRLGAKLIATTVGEDGYEGFEYHLLQKGNLFSIVSYAYGDYSGLDGDPGPNTVKDFIAQTKMGNHSGEGQFQSKQALLSSFSHIFDNHDKQAEAFMRSKLNLKESLEHITEAATPGKPETMAQKHGRMSRFGEAMYNHKEYLAFAKQVAKDWHSGDMALNRMQSLIESDFAWLMRTNIHGINTGYVNAEHETEIQNLMKAFRKRVKSEGLEPTSRLGDGGGFVGSAMGKITPNQIGEYFDLIVNFITIDWPKIAPSTLK